jgi:chorismate mutase
MKSDLKITPVCTWLEGARRPLIVSGPCSAESEAQVLSTAQAIAAIDGRIIYRAGVWKPRTRPGAFEGAGIKALEWMRAVKQQTGLLTATEVANAAHVEACLRYGIDVLWIGARTTVNPFSVQEIADALRGTDIPVLVKNPIHPDLQLWLGAFERLDRAGISKLVGVHRGFHTAGFSPFRNDPQWEQVIELRVLCPQLPVLCDPSHICGCTELIPYIAQKALDMDMHGLMIETHCVPAAAKSDARQQLTPAQLAALLRKLVVRKANAGSEAAREELGLLRQEIDRTDECILQALLKRMHLAGKIGEYKKDQGMTILQTGRWEQLLNARMASAAVMGLDEELTRSLFRLLHEASIRRQAEIMNEELVVDAV